MAQARLAALRALQWLVGTILFLSFAGSAQAAGSEWQATVLRAKGAEFDAWKTARVLMDPQAELSAEQALARLDDFTTPKVAANLGRIAGAAWIAVYLQRDAASPTSWVLALDYPSLDRIDLHLQTAGRLKRVATLGDSVARPPEKDRVRSHAWPLELTEDGRQLLLVRVETSGSMVVPLMLYTPQRHQAVEAQEQALQGILAGAGLCLLFYSLTQWVMLRTAAFGYYALTLLGTGCFFAALSGMGAQHVWGDHEWLTRNAPPLFILVGITGAFFFTLSALEVDQVSPRIGRFVRLCGVISGSTAVAFCFDLLSYQAAQAVGMALGPAPLLLVMRVAVQRVRGGDRAAAFLLAGWGCYSVGVLLLVGMLQGALPVNFWTTHGFQFASMVEMTTWLLVLGQRVHVIRQAALKAQADHDRVQEMANTDPLTGLLNRRGLNEALEICLPKATADRQLALYLIDLDGFKGVNDQLGHEAGDELLVGVAKRLRAQMRSNDLVCRVGGDEFIVVATGLPSERVAHLVGQKLMNCTAEPFPAVGTTCRVGMTVGYAIAPTDDTSAQGLIKQADAAMYAGKRAGRQVLTHSRDSASVLGA